MEIKSQECVEQSTIEFEGVQNAAINISIRVGKRGGSSEALSPSRFLEDASL